MSFGLTKALATFQSCMNQIFKMNLLKSALDFFHDILIFSRTWEEHFVHLDEILSLMEEHTLFAKESKWKFGVTKILYLDHMIGV